MDPGLFEQTVLPHLNAAYNLSRWMTRNSDDAEDVAQEAYLKAFRSFQTCQATTAKKRAPGCWQSSGTPALRGFVKGAQRP